MNYGGVLDMEEFLDSHKNKEEEWVEIQEQKHDCPDCMALIKVVVEKQPSSGNIRSRLVFLEHRI